MPNTSGPGVLPRTPDGNYTIGPDPPATINALVEVLGHLGETWEGTVVVAALLGFVVAIATHYVAPKRLGQPGFLPFTKPDFVPRSLFAAIGVFGITILLRAVAWLSTGSTGYASSLDLSVGPGSTDITDPVSLPAGHLPSGSMVPDIIASDPRMSGWLTAVYGRSFALQTLTFVYGGAVLAIFGIVLWITSDSYRNIGRTITTGAIAVITAVFSFQFIAQAVGWFAGGSNTIESTYDFAEPPVENGIDPDPQTLPSSYLTGIDVGSGPINTITAGTDSVLSLFGNLLTAGLLTATYVSLILALVGVAYLVVERQRKDMGRRYAMWGTITAVTVYGIQTLVGALAWLGTGGRSTETGEALPDVDTLAVTSLDTSPDMPTDEFNREIAFSVAKSPDAVLDTFGNFLATSLFTIVVAGAFVTVIGVIVYGAGNNRGKRLFLVGSGLAIGSFGIHVLLAGLSWIFIGSPDSNQGNSLPENVSISADSLNTQPVLPVDRLQGAGVDYPVVPQQASPDPLLFAMEKGLETAITTLLVGFLLLFVVGVVLVVWKPDTFDNRHLLAVGAVGVLVVFLVPSVLTGIAWVGTGAHPANLIVEVGGGPYVKATAFESESSEGWTATSGTLQVTQTNATRDEYGILFDDQVIRTFTFDTISGTNGRIYIHLQDTQTAKVTLASNSGQLDHVVVDGSAVIWIPLPDKLKVTMTAVDDSVVVTHVEIRPAYNRSLGV